MQIINGRRKALSLKKLTMLKKPLWKPYTIKSLSDQKADTSLDVWIAKLLKNYKKQCRPKKKTPRNNCVEFSLDKRGLNLCVAGTGNEGD